MSILDATEVSKAQVGPRELKNPRSREYAIQTLYALKRFAESLRCDQERVETELARIDQYEHWKVLGYSSREALLEAELNDLGRYNVTEVLRGNAPSYLAARLERDHPDIAARVEAGEFRSIHAAALAAGIVRPTATVYIDTPDAAIKALLRRFTREELLAALNGGA